ncbi:MAG: hypothetical protein R3C25_05485 [Hyphomonadaceae bacterium]
MHAQNGLAHDQPHRREELQTTPISHTHVPPGRSGPDYRHDTARAVAARARGADTIDIVLAGRRASSTLAQLAACRQPGVARGLKLRISALYQPLYTSVDVSLRDVFPQISMSVSGMPLSR